MKNKKNKGREHKCCWQVGRSKTQANTPPALAAALVRSLPRLKALVVKHFG